jgi:hypothetical protein
MLHRLFCFLETQAAQSGVEFVVGALLIDDWPKPNTTIIDVNILIAVHNS